MSMINKAQGKLAKIGYDIIEEIHCPYYVQDMLEDYLYNGG